MENVPISLKNLKSKVGKLDVGKLAPVPINLSELTDAVKNEVIQKDAYSPKIKNIEGKWIDNINLANSATLNSKIKELKREITSITNLPSTIALFAVEN